MSQQFGTRRERAKRETRQIILENAYALFEEKGYAKTTMRELASNAEVGLGTIFQHFPDKPSLLIAAFEEELGAMVDKAFASMPDSGIKDQLMHLIRPIFRFYGKRPLLARVLLKEIFFLEGKAAEKINAVDARVSQRLEQILTESVNRGELDPDINIPDAVNMMWAYYTLVLLQGLRQPGFDPDSLIGLVGKLFDQHMIGIGRKGGQL